MHPIKKRKSKFLNKYNELDSKYQCKGELIKLIDYFFKKNWIYNTNPDIVKETNNLFFNTKKFHIALCFDGYYEECVGFVKVYTDLRNRYDKAKYSAIQFEIYKNNVDTFINIIEKIEKDKDYYKLVDEGTYPFEEGYAYTPDPKFKHPKELY